MHPKIQRVGVIGIIGFSVLSSGCRSIGPKTIPRDRFDYSAGIGDSWKNQTLLNIIKLRYLDLPIFLDVAQVVSGYQLETGVSVGGQVSSASGTVGNNLVLGASGKFVDRPTITYMPLTGDEFLEGFLKPVQPSQVFYMLQTGYAADFLLDMSLDSLNGLHNRSTAYGETREADPEFMKATSLLRDIQAAGAVGIHVQKPKTEEETTQLFFRTERVDPEIKGKISGLKDLLSIPPDRYQLTLVVSPLRGTPDELAVTTRSLLQVLGALGAGIELPKAHVERKLVPPVTEASLQEQQLFRVHSGTEKPDDVYVAVRYEDAWFWIEHEDWHTKRTFVFIMFLFTLADAGQQQNLPQVTIPAQ